MFIWNKDKIYYLVNKTLDKIFGIPSISLIGKVEVFFDNKKVAEKSKLITNTGLTVIAKIIGFKGSDILDFVVGNSTTPESPNDTAVSRIYLTNIFDFVFFEGVKTKVDREIIAYENSIVVKYYFISKVRWRQNVNQLSFTEIGIIGGMLELIDRAVFQNPIVLQNDGSNELKTFTVVYSLILER